MVYTQDRSSIGVLANIADHQERKYRTYIEQNNTMGTSLAMRLAKGEQFEGLLGGEVADRCRNQLKDLVKDNVEKERQLKAYVQAIRVVIDDAGRTLSTQQQQQQQQQHDVVEDENQDIKPTVTEDKSTEACEFKDKMDAAYTRALDGIAKDCVLITQEQTYLNLCRQLGDDEPEDDELAVVHNHGSSSSSDRRIKCPLTLAVMTDPVRSKVCKHSFQREAIFEYLDRAKQANKGRRKPNPIRCPVPGCVNSNMTVDELEDDPETLLRVRRYKKRESAVQRARAQTAIDMEEDDEFEF